MRIVFVITSLGPGGAERMLLKLVQGLPSQFDPVVVSLGGAGVLSDALRRTGAEVHDLGMTGLASVPQAIATLARLSRRYRPSVVSTWMYHADLVGGLAARLARVPALAWNIRNSDLSAEHSKWSTRGVARLNARLSRRLPDTIICCSEEARRIHVDLGYDDARFVLIPNGFDLARYAPDPAAGASVREELSIPADAPLIGLVARWDRQKNHGGFLRGAAALRQRVPDAHFLMVGSGVTPDNPELSALVRQLGLGTAIRMLGHRTDVSRLTASLDIATSTSTYGEAFPNVLGEAMACGVPCVATRVGDSALIVADTGCIVPPDDTPALVAAWEGLLRMGAAARASLGGRARERVSQHFEIGAIRARYAQLFTELVARSPQR